MKRGSRDISATKEGFVHDYTLSLELGNIEVKIMQATFFFFAWKWQIFEPFG